MTAISLKRYWEVSSTETWQRTLALVVESVTRDLVAVDPGEGARFVTQVRHIQNEFPPEATGEQLLGAVGKISEAMAEHNHAVTSFVQRQGSELQKMVGMLTETVKSMSTHSDVCVGNLETIADQLKSASALEDIYVLRIRLADCLKDVRTEAVRQKTEIQINLEGLKHELAAIQQRGPYHGIEADVDRVTGFAGRSAAEVGIQEALNAGDRRYLLITVLGKMQAINARFGFAVGDELFCEFAARVAGRLCRNTTFYRWSGPTVVGILQRSEPIHVIHAEVAKIVEGPVAKSLVNGEQNALISTSAAWQLIPLLPPAADVVARIDSFVTAQIPTEHL